MANIKEKSSPTITSKDRMTVEGTTPSAGLSNVSQQDNASVLMNLPEMASRGSRADALVEMAGEDGYRLSQEIRKTKIKG